MIEPQYKKLLAEGKIDFGVDGNSAPRTIRYLADVEGVVPWTWWTHEEVGHTDEAKKEIYSYFGKDDAFDTPKPTRLIRRVLEIGTKAGSEDIVLDFFAGSGTAAQATLELNRADGGNRQFVLVQLPEPTVNTLFPTIAELGKERIRRVIAKLNAETPDITRTAPEDLGFKMFKLARPFVAPFEPPAGADVVAYSQNLYDNERLAPGWTAEGVLWEVALRHGFGLNSAFAAKTLPNGATVWEVTDPDREPPQNRIAVCLDDAVRADLSKHYPLGKDDTLVCRDSALDDTAAANLALQCRLKTI